MKKIILSESEKNNILSLYNKNIINEEGERTANYEVIGSYYTQDSQSSSQPPIVTINSNSNLSPKELGNYTKNSDLIKKLENQFKDNNNKSTYEPNKEITSSPAPSNSQNTQQGGGGSLDSDTKNTPNKEEPQKYLAAVPIRAKAVQTLNSWTSYNNNIKNDSEAKSMRKFGSGQVQSKIDNALKVINSISDKDLCTQSAAQKLKKLEDDMNDTISSYGDLMTTKDNKYVNDIKANITSLKNTCS